MSAYISNPKRCYNQKYWIGEYMGASPVSAKTVQKVGFIWAHKIEINKDRILDQVQSM